MLLPRDLVSCRTLGDRLLPSWLGPGDEALAARVLDAAAALVGLASEDAEIVMTGRLAAIAADARVSSRALGALWAIERRRWETQIEAARPPAEVRDVVFELAARHPRDEALARAAARLGIPVETVVGSLYADRPPRRLLVAPPERRAPADLVAEYNLGLAQTLLSRSMELTARTTSDPAAVASAAKRDGLLVRLLEDAEETVLELFGALGMFRETAKYGRAIARFVPALMAGKRWSIEARVMVAGRAVRLSLSHEGDVAFPPSLPAAPDGRLARRLARDLAALGVRADLHPPLVRGGGTLLVPDLAIDVGGTVFVDVVPFATPEYLRTKRDAVVAANVPLVVCVEARSVGDAPPPELAVLPWRGAIDALALLEKARAALSVARVPWPPSAQPPSSSASPLPSSLPTSVPASRGLRAPP